MIKIILMVSGVLFWLQVFGLGWFYVADPLHFFSKNENILVEGVNLNNSPESATSSKDVENSALSSVGTNVKASDAQAKAAASLGVEIPTFTNEQITCFEKIFGVARVTEIKNGAVPTPVEMYKGKGCL